MVESVETESPGLHLGHDHVPPAGQIGLPANLSLSSPLLHVIPTEIISTETPLLLSLHIDAMLVWHLSMLYPSVKSSSFQIYKTTISSVS